MRDLRFYLTNPFDDSKISLNRKKKFGEDHIQRIQVQNVNGRFTQMLSATITVQNALFGGITAVETNTAIRSARTQTVDAVMDAFKSRNTRFNSYLVAMGIKGTPVYKEFFPQGVQAFTRDISKENIEQRMQELVTAITANRVAAGGNAVLAEYQKMLADYKTARGNQLNKVAEVESGDRDLEHKEESWNDQVFNNLLTLANIYRDQPEELSVFMDQSLLRTPQNVHDDKGEITGIVSNEKGTPLAGVQVHVMDNHVSDVTTNKAGSYHTQHLPAGTYQVQYSKDYLAPVTGTVTINDKENIVNNVVIGG